MGLNNAIEINKLQAQQIMNKYNPDSAPIASFHEQESNGSISTSYTVVLSDNTSYKLKVGPSQLPAGPTYSPNTLTHEHALLLRIAEHTGIPHLPVLILDVTQSVVPHHYLLTRTPQGIPLSRARASGKLTERQSILLDLRAGAYLKELHENVQNDWFGLPSQAADELYSWPEAFTLLLESLLQDAQDRGLDLPYEDIRRYLSRAIGSFLFDDCEAPSLISFLGDEDAIIVDFDPESPARTEEVPITSFLSFERGLWGDPLLESLFMEPSEALTEGYGGSPIVFARQKTKRLWYTLFLALVITVQPDGTSFTVNDDKLDWAKRTLKIVVEQLKDAPCY